MMPTQDIINIQTWYIKALKNAERFAHLPIQREIFKRDAEAALAEFKETYGEELAPWTI